jgi:heat shock protein HtpX
VELTKNPDAMISALRKIEGRGELPGATSAVMELCLDNPREGFSDLFATHPSVEARVQALVKYAGGHYQGPLALPMHPSGEPDGRPDQPESGQVPPPLPSAASLNAPSGPSSGPWGSATDPAAASQSAPDGPWGNHPAGPWGRR